MVRGAEYITTTLKQAGIDIVFGYPGGAIMPVYDALVDSGIQHVLCRHEQGAALAADGFSRASGKLGVCIGTSGPGATNLMTGIANAYLDSIPMLVITGQVPRPLIGTDAFQEVDVLGLTMPIVKHSYLVEDINELPHIMQEAMIIATSGRPGPVLIDVPKDIQMMEFDPSSPDIEPCVTQEIMHAPVAIDWHKIIELVNKSEKPVIYHGGGIQMAGATQQLRDFVAATRIPAVHTLKGIGNLPTDWTQNIGMIGMHGLKAANAAVQESDLLLVLGARFDDRATGKLAEFAPHAHVIHADTDPAEFDKLRQSDTCIGGDLKSCLLELIQHFPRKDWNEWNQQCQQNKERYQWNYDYPYEDIYAPAFLQRLSQLASKRAVISCDVGQHQMWVAQHCAFESPNLHLSSGALGTMGYGLPAAIGAQFGLRDALVINISGDGSFMMNVQEMATIKRYRLPVKIIIIDNQSLGMVRQWQELFFAERYSEVDLSDNPEFTELAQCFGFEAEKIERAEQIDGAIHRLLNNKHAHLLQVCIDPKANVWPLVPPGANNLQMMEGQAK